MQLPDVSVLIHAHRQDAPEHERYGAWLQALTGVQRQVRLAHSKGVRRLALSPLDSQRVDALARTPSGTAEANRVDNLRGRRLSSAIAADRARRTSGRGQPGDHSTAESASQARRCRRSSAEAQTAQCAVCLPCTALQMRKQGVNDPACRCHRRPALRA